MIGSPVLYILFVISIILQVITVVLLSAKLKSIEDLINTNNIEFKQLKYLSSYDEPKTVEKPTSTVSNSIPVQDNDDVLFVKEIKLDRRSNVIDLDVQVNSRNK